MYRHSCAARRASGVSPRVCYRAAPFHPTAHKPRGGDPGVSRPKIAVEGCLGLVLLQPMQSTNEPAGVPDPLIRQYFQADGVLGGRVGRSTAPENADV